MSAFTRMADMYEEVEAENEQLHRQARRLKAENGQLHTQVRKLKAERSELLDALKKIAAMNTDPERGAGEAFALAMKGIAREAARNAKERGIDAPDGEWLIEKLVGHEVIARAKGGE